MVLADPSRARRDDDIDLVDDDLPTPTPLHPPVGPAEPVGPTSLLVVTAGRSDADAVAETLGRQAPSGVRRVTGYYAAVASAPIADPRPLVVDLAGHVDDRELWQLSGLRARLGEATVVVVAPGPVLPALSGALQADLAVASAADLPPLRELS
jgi:hypothetical protein